MKNTYKISYRSLTIHDLNLRQNWLNDAETNRYLGARVRQGTDLEFHKKWFKNYLEDEKEGERLMFIIQDGDEPIGQVGFSNINKLNKYAYLYIMIGNAEYRGKGLSQPILKFICEYGFKELKLHKISLEVHADNTAGVKAYKKFGFVEEGVLKDNVYHDGKFSDEIVMSIFEDAYRAACKPD